MKKGLIIALVLSTVIISILVGIIIAVYQIHENGIDKFLKLKNDNNKQNEINNVNNIARVQNVDLSETTQKAENPVATIEVEDFGTIKVELYPDQAPNTVTNFIRLANRGFYNNLTFHRIIEGFMIQGGDPKGDGTGSPILSDIKDDGNNSEYCIKGEFSKNGYKENNMEFERGVIAMARADYSSIGKTKEGYNSAGSQFFIMHKKTESLNGLYAGFGKVIEGIEIVDKIASVAIEESGQNDKPVNPPIIKQITVETYGVEYGEPETLEPFAYNEWIM